MFITETVTIRFREVFTAVLHCEGDRSDGTAAARGRQRRRRVHEERTRTRHVESPRNVSRASSFKSSPNWKRRQIIRVEKTKITSKNDVIVSTVLWSDLLSVSGGVPGVFAFDVDRARFFAINWNGSARLRVNNNVTVTSAIREHGNAAFMWCHFCLVCGAAES